MLYIFRLIITMIYSILIYVFDPICCLFNPRNPRHVVTFGHILDRLALLLDLKVECRKPADAGGYGNAIYVANHRNNYDMATTSNIVQLPTVMIGKKSLLWIPFFGQLYWLTSNLLISRNNYTKAHGTIAEVTNYFKRCHISVWMFPEGIRSRGHGLLPFKTGAPHAAIAVGVPIIPACVSTTSNKISLNRLHNGLVTVEMLPPTDVGQHGKGQVRELAAYCRSIIEQKITELDKEVAEREAVGKV